MPSADSTCQNFQPSVFFPSRMTWPAVEGDVYVWSSTTIVPASVRPPGLSETLLNDL